MRSPPWRRLRSGLIVCVACTLAGGGAAGAGWWRERGAAQAFERAHARLATARERYLALAEERRQWRRFGPRFEELHAQGRISHTNLKKACPLYTGAHLLLASIPKVCINEN